MVTTTTIAIGMVVICFLLAALRSEQRRAAEFETIISDLQTDNREQLHETMALRDELVQHGDNTETLHCIISFLNSRLDSYQTADGDDGVEVSDGTIFDDEVPCFSFHTQHRLSPADRVTEFFPKRAAKVPATEISR